MGFGRNQKYEVENGPSFADCVSLLRRESAVPVEDIERLMRWLVLNVLAGNSDGHSKNLALLQDRAHLDQWRLAPFYDMVCNEALDRVETKIAFSIDGQSVPQSLTRAHWDDESVACGLRRGTLVTVAGELSKTLPALTRELRTEFEDSTKAPRRYSGWSLWSTNVAGRF